MKERSNLSERKSIFMIKEISISNINNKFSFKAFEQQMAINIQMPAQDRNYCLFDQKKVNFYVSQKEQALPYLKNVLQSSTDEREIVETLYILDRLADSKTKGIPAMYPVLAKFNNTDSPNIQAFLAGIYRKTLVPDAFGPLIKMLIKDSLSQDKSKADPTEEVGGAILEYINAYSKSKPQIDYTA